MNKTLIIFKLRAVAEELIRTADLIDGKISDKIGFFAEKGNKGSIWLEKDWRRPRISGLIIFNRFLYYFYEIWLFC